MIAQRSIFRSSGQASLFNQALRIFDPISDRPFNAPLCASNNSHLSAKSLSHSSQHSNAFPGCVEKLKGGSRHHAADVLGGDSKAGSHFLGDFGMKLGFMKAKENVFPPSAVSFRSFIHSESRKEAEMGKNTRSMDFVRGIMDEDGKDGRGDPRNHADQNADIVHIKILRNNTFVTLTDSEGNTKAKSTVGLLEQKEGTKSSGRFSGEATAEQVGRIARSMGVKSVVVKVSGFTYFKKKKQAILSFREGYTHGRGDQNPIVYLEDTTRLPHNGCRRPKKRRV
ncbi:small ribosomal subunit protein uS11m-like [Cornus florida]|uniref:small ribosomal subunit protein uS11m-like n=1 Tax=Cornus florida TaxID=4283 RepID=UPI0028A1EAF5|nr:small ribosomal subunit protein uS11m-like [Cornus florida]XP_059670510.1 small ribosomal subunit protein uS11m-like [Cornus florida]XP_059670512.1 small ribosomal subunit protein uS11m-like [Cornus florida]XP_059670513.1 small ribosomal subunit protein uS11m-like [Cornus florida]XP_059670514.1 small ribosomal subunit protein uS11m-like [Cornus florida]XP_059670515.1 small ribosomal subunit protein uS11m-like [Cornus florida]XP_059670516.1 small ribosomal subunit protein uS11m-like [Cornus